jgi:hypothetical protein
MNVLSKCAKGPLSSNQRSNICQSTKLNMLNVYSRAELRPARAILHLQTSA